MNQSRQIPRPTGSTLRHTLRFMKNPFSLVDEAFRECGDIFSMRIMGFGEMVFLCSPDLAKAMFKAPPDILKTGEINGSSLGHILGLSATFSLDEPEHRERQKIIQPYLNRLGGLRQVDNMRAFTERRVSQWPIGKPFSLLDQTQRIALEVIIKMMFGSASPEKAKRLTDLFERLSMDGLRSPVVGIPLLQIDLGRFSMWGRIKQLQRAVVDAFSEEIEPLLTQQDETDDDDILLALARAQLKDGSRLTKDDLLAESLNLLFAGHEVTGNFMAWILGEILLNPEILGRLQDELAAVAQGGPIEPDHLPQLEFLEAVILEGLRFHPVGPFTGIRRVKEPYPIGDYVLPEGTIVAHCFPVMAKRKDIFSHPERFDPDAHFCGRKRSAFEWNPFGGGTRRCTGKGLAEVEMKVVLGTILQRAELTLVQGVPKPVRNGFFFAPDNGLLVTLDRRHDQLPAPATPAAARAPAAQAPLKCPR